MEWSIALACKHRTSASQQMDFTCCCRGSEQYCTGQLPSQYEGDRATYRSCLFDDDIVAHPCLLINYARPFHPGCCKVHLDCPRNTFRPMNRIECRFSTALAGLRHCYPVVMRMKRAARVGPERNQSNRSVYYRALKSP
jgi:hypothetical protein